MEQSESQICFLHFSATSHKEPSPLSCWKLLFSAHWSKASKTAEKKLMFCHSSPGVLQAAVTAAELNHVFSCCMMSDRCSPKAGGGQGKGEAVGGLKFAVYPRKLGDRSNTG